MRTLPRLGMIAWLSVALTSCNDDDMSERTVSEVARGEIATNTSETTEPILVNDLSLSSKDTTETKTPSAL